MNPQRAVEARALGQSLWYDNISRALLDSGELRGLIDAGIVTGITTNPTIFQKAVDGTDAYDDAIRRLAGEGRDAAGIYHALTLADVREAADLLRAVYESSDGVDGYVSLELPPALADDAEGSVVEARRLVKELDRPNVMIKVPGTPAGVEAFRTLTDEGYNINVTLLFSLDQYVAVACAYIDGLTSRASRGEDVKGVASVASFFVSRVDSAVDKALDGCNADAALKGQAGVANCKVVYERFQELFGGGFAELAAKGARPQRVLWASTSTKNPEYPDCLYVDTLLGADTVNTLPPATLVAFLDHGNTAAGATVEAGLDEARQHLASLADLGIDLDAVCEKLLVDGLKSFADSFDALLASLKSEAERLSTVG